MCYWGAPWSVSNTLSYGYAAFNGVACGTCYQLDFTGSGSTTTSGALKGKSMIVQVINIGDIGANHFDLLIPGGGVGANNACTSNGKQWGSADIGSQSGGMLAGCSANTSCVTTKCQAAFGSMPLLLAGCEWFTGWFGAADNPNIVYQKVSCPAAISAKSGIGG
jgi:hypothetical protein